MAYSVTTNYDPRIPSWQGNGTPFTLIACHDTEGGQGRAGALGTIQFLIDRADRGASYHEMWWYHESTDDFGVIRIVQPFRAAGSIAPQPTYYQPTTWVKSAMGANWWDPNQGAYAVSIAGRVADVDRYARNPKFLAHAHRRMLELWKELGLTKRAEHFQFQPSNRSDWGKVLMPALGGLVTTNEYQPPVETAMDLKLVMKLEYWTAPEGAVVRREPAATGEVLTTLAGGPVVSVAETADGLWRLVLLGANADTGGWILRRGMTPATPGGDPTLQERWLTAVYTDIPFDTDSAEEDAMIADLQGKVGELSNTVATQTDIIAGLKTDLATAQADSAGAAELRTALRNFMG